MVLVTELSSGPFPGTGQMAQYGHQTGVTSSNPTMGPQPSLQAVPTIKAEETAQPEKDVKKATRPVNSFMMFRSYYNRMFGNALQKEISPILTFLWKNDPMQNKWSILARAYSIIRDAQGKEMSPTDAFLRLNAPFVNVPHPGNYLFAMGWVVTNEPEAHIVRLGNLDLNYVPMHHSVHDIVQNCINNGFVQIGNLNVRQFDVMMVRADGREHTEQMPVSDNLNYTLELDGEDYAGFDFDPLICDPFHPYNVSEPFV